MDAASANKTFVDSLCGPLNAFLNESVVAWLNVVRMGHIEAEKACNPAAKEYKLQAVACELVATKTAKKVKSKIKEKKRASEEIHDLLIELPRVQQLSVLEKDMDEAALFAEHAQDERL